MIISLANSFRFWVVDDELPNFNNQPYRNVYNRNFRTRPYFQKYYDTDVVTIQIKAVTSISSTVPVFVGYKPDGSSVSFTHTLQWFTGGSFYWQFEIDFSTIGSSKVWFMVTNTTDGVDYKYKSEIIDILSEEDESLKLIQWANIENNFEVDYSKGIVHAMRLECSLRLGDASGELETWDNLDEITTLLDEVIRVMKLSTVLLPEQFIEKIRIALAHDLFFVNEIQYTKTALPEYTDGENVNLKTLAVNLSQTSVIGLNTHDTGFDCDETEKETMKVLSKSNASTSFTDWTVSDGYLASYLTIKANSGTGIEVYIGTTIDGDDVLASINLTAGDPVFNEDIGMALGVDGDKQLYVTIAGSGVDLDMTLITFLNEQ